MPSIGSLRERLTIQYKSTTSDGQGGRSVSWNNTLAVVWARMTALSGRELLQAGAIGSTVVYRAVIRVRSDVTAKMRVTWTPSWSSATPTKTLEISAVRPSSSDPTSWLELDCSELV